MDDVRTTEAEVFPPFFTPVRLRERVDAFAHAVVHATRDGAGTIYHVGRFDLIEFAVVLEPEEPLSVARRVFFAGMNAVADTLAAECPPEKPVTFRYAGAIAFDGGLVGGARLAWPEGTAEDQTPDWLVFSTMLRSGGFQELGFVLDPSATTLEEEGFRDLQPEAFAARFCRHLMFELDDWRERGFRGIGPRYLARLERPTAIALCGIDRNGDLMATPKGGGAVLRTDFVAASAGAGWLDPATGEPRG